MAPKPSRRARSGFIDGGSIDEGDLVDLAQGGDAFEHFLQRRLAQEDHALLLGDALDLRGGTAREDELADGVGEVEQLGNGETAVEPGAVTLDTAAALVEHLLAVDLGIEPALLEQLARDLRRPLAVRADLAHQALGEHAVERRDEVVEVD